MTASETNTTTTPEATAPRSALFNALLGLTTSAILLQGLWAGIFLEHDGKRDAASGWLNIHSAGANVAVVLALARPSSPPCAYDPERISSAAAPH